MDEFLAMTLEKMNEMNSTQLDEMSLAFRKSMVNNYLVFERHAFRRHIAEDASRSVINVALFDVFSILMARFELNYVQERIDKIRKRFYILMEDQDFMSSITLSTNSVRKVIQRFRIIEEAFQDL